MFKVNDIPILENDLNVLKKLKNDLAEMGINRFATFNVGPKNIQFNCPIHSDGQEKNPSCGISTADQPNTPSGTVHCFSCGYVATLAEMVSHCFGYDDFGRFGTNWLTTNFLTVAVENREDIPLAFSREQNKNENAIDPEELKKYNKKHSYMKKRKLTDEVIKMFNVGYDNQNDCLTFPVKNSKGDIIFIARRSVKGKFFNYPTGVEKPVYGIYELREYAKDVEEIIICEGIIDALTCWGYGKPAVALLGLGTQKQYDQLKNLKCRNFIVAFDGDLAGDRASEKIIDKLKDYKIMNRYVLPSGKDINDLSKNQFENLLKIF